MASPASGEAPPLPPAAAEAAAKAPFSLRYIVHRLMYPRTSDVERLSTEPHQCPLCNSSLANRSSLARHIGDSCSQVPQSERSGTKIEDAINALVNVLVLHMTNPQKQIDDLPSPLKELMLGLRRAAAQASSVRDEMERLLYQGLSTEQQHLCPLCGDSFEARGSLVTHIGNSCKQVPKSERSGTSRLEDAVNVLVNVLSPYVTQPQKQIDDLPPSPLKQSVLRLRRNRTVEEHVKTFVHAVRQGEEAVRAEVPPAVKKPALPLCPRDGHYDHQIERDQPGSRPCPFDHSNPPLEDLTIFGPHGEQVNVTCLVENSAKDAMIAFQRTSAAWCQNVACTDPTTCSYLHLKETERPTPAWLLTCIQVREGKNDNVVDMPVDRCVQNQGLERALRTGVVLDECMYHGNLSHDPHRCTYWHDHEKSNPATYVAKTTPDASFGEGSSSESRTSCIQVCDENDNVVDVPVDRCVQNRGLERALRTGVVLEVCMYHGNPSHAPRRCTYWHPAGDHTPEWVFVREGAVQSKVMVADLEETAGLEYLRKNTASGKWCIHQAQFTCGAGCKFLHKRDPANTTFLPVDLVSPANYAATTEPSEASRTITGAEGGVDRTHRWRFVVGGDTGSGKTTLCRRIVGLDASGSEDEPLSFGRTVGFHAFCHEVRTARRADQSVDYDVRPEPFNFETQRADGVSLLELWDMGGEQRYQHLAACLQIDAIFVLLVDVSVSNWKQRCQEWLVAADVQGNTFWKRLIIVPTHTTSSHTYKKELQTIALATGTACATHVLAAEDITSTRLIDFCTRFGAGYCEAVPAPFNNPPRVSTIVNTLLRLDEPHCTERTLSGNERRGEYCFDLVLSRLEKIPIGKLDAAARAKKMADLRRDVAKVLERFVLGRIEPPTHSSPEVCKLPLLCYRYMDLPLDVSSLGVSVTSRTSIGTFADYAIFLYNVDNPVNKWTDCSQHCRFYNDNTSGVIVVEWRWVVLGSLTAAGRRLEITYRNSMGSATPNWFNEWKRGLHLKAVASGKEVEEEPRHRRDTTQVEAKGFAELHCHLKGMGDHDFWLQLMRRVCAPQNAPDERAEILKAKFTPDVLEQKFIDFALKSNAESRKALKCWIPDNADDESRKAAAKYFFDHRFTDNVVYSKEVLLASFFGHDPKSLPETNVLDEKNAMWMLEMNLSNPKVPNTSFAASFRSYLVYNEEKEAFEVIRGLPNRYLLQVMEWDRPTGTEQTDCGKAIEAKLRNCFSMLTRDGKWPGTADLMTYRGSFSPEFYPQRFHLKDALFAQRISTYSILLDHLGNRYKQADVRYVEYSMSLKDLLNDRVMEVCEKAVDKSRVDHDLEIKFLAAFIRGKAAYPKSRDALVEKWDSIPIRLVNEDLSSCKWTAADRREFVAAIGPVYESHMHEICENLFSAEIDNLEALRDALLLGERPKKKDRNGIVIVDEHLNSQDANKARKTRLQKLVVGVDNVGEEDGFPFSCFASKRAIACIQGIRNVNVDNVKVLAHFGVRLHGAEGVQRGSLSGLESRMIRANFHAHLTIIHAEIRRLHDSGIPVRIGHGVAFLCEELYPCTAIKGDWFWTKAALYSPSSLLRDLNECGVVFELNMTSNETLMTNMMADKQIPDANGCKTLKRMLNRGVAVVLSTDDDGIWNCEYPSGHAQPYVSVAAEFAKAICTDAANQDECLQMWRTAWRAAFRPQ